MSHVAHEGFIHNIVTVHMFLEAVPERFFGDIPTPTLHAAHLITLDHSIYSRNHRSPRFIQCTADLQSLKFRFTILSCSADFQIVLSVNVNFSWFMVKATLIHEN